MRRYQRFAVILAIWAAALYWSGTAAWRASLAWLEEHRKIKAFGLAGSAQRSLAYHLSAGQWLEFALPEASRQLRVVSNLNVNLHGDSPVQTAGPPQRWQYALHYQLIDSRGKLLADQVYYQNSRLTVYRDAQGDFYHANYYSDSPLTPLDGRLMLLGSRALPQAAYLRLKLETAEPQAADAVVRVYVPAKIAEHRIGTRWLRLNEKQQETLANHSVYPASHLSEQEKLNLIRHQWDPVGPRGVQGKDYHSRFLYALDDISYDKMDTLIAPFGAISDTQHAVTLALPEAGGRLFLELRAAAADLQVSSGVPIGLRWFGRTQKERWQREMLWNGKEGQLDFQVAGGLLEVRATAPLAVTKAWLQPAGGGEKSEIAVQPFTTAAVYADAGVEYNVLHVDNKPAAIRIDVRRVFSGEAAEPPPLVYQWLNRDGQSVQSGELRAPNVPSQYDRLKQAEGEYEVSDAQHYYFNVPASVQRIRISAKRHDLLVSLYNQPDALLRRTRIPEGVYAGAQADETQFPGWFIVKPRNEKALLMQQLIAQLSVQLRPPEDDPHLARGVYLWQDYLPDNQRQTYYLLTPYEADVRRDEALSNLYCQLPLNRGFHAAVKGYGARRTVTPELIFVHPDAQAVDFSFTANQRELMQATSAGRQGVFYLPELATGPYRLQLSSRSDSQWLMNNIDNCSGAQYLKRKVFPLDRRHKLIFTVEHGAAQNETLSAMIHAAAHSEKRSLIQVEIAALQAAGGEAGAQAFSDWTFRRRLFDVRQPQDDASLLLFTGGARLNAGERFFIPVNSDLPAGQYRITISLADGAPGFITLSKVTPGMHAQRYFYREGYR